MYMSHRSFFALPLLPIFASLFAGANANASPPEFGGEILNFDRGNIEWVPASKGEGAVKDPGQGPIPASGWVEFDFEVATPGWYVLSFKEMPNLAREIILDGKRMALTFGNSRKRAADLLGIGLKDMTVDGWTKEINLPLAAGKHTLRFQRVGRMGFPPGMPREWELRPSGDSPADRIRAEVVGPRELRKGEPLTIAVTGGGGEAASYQIFRVNEETNAKEKVAEVEFPAGRDFTTKKLDILTAVEGVFSLVAESSNGMLTPSEFLEGAYFVVDTSARPTQGGSDAKMKLLYEVDCIANTINGKEVTKGENFWEANGETRISESPAGKYRESGNGLGPETDPMARAFQSNFSGFAYLFDVPDPGKPYLIEIEHPDDDWRSICVPVSDVLDMSADPPKGNLPRTYAYETGGYLPLSNKLLTEKFMFWPNGKQLHLGLVSARIGKRAAAAKIKIYEIEGALPSQARGAEGRFLGIWMEEPERWHAHFNTPEDLPSAVRDYVGLTRTMEWASYTGRNAFWPSVAAYQNATYPSEELVGYLLGHNNIPRLSALLCEKYGMGYVAEVFLAKQRYFNEVTMLEGVENPKDLYTGTWWGYSAAESEATGGILPNWNILHPHVQDKMIDLYGELADMLADTKSFMGVAGRLMGWRWDGLYGLTSLNWGYEDWTIQQFEKDTGVKVPGEPDAADRFETRYRFLTSPEMLDQWVAWRTERVGEFLKRMGARVRSAKKDATFFVVGEAKTDEVHRPSVPKDLEKRLEGMGIDPSMFAEDSGVTIMPAASFGRGKTRTYLQDQEAYDEFLDPDYVSAGGGSLRSFAFNGAYQEWGTEFPLDKLGLPLKRWHYTTGSDAAGLNSLERLSVVLAEQDTMAIREGGYPLLPGRNDFFSDWMANYSALPRAPFDPVEGLRDPVAVWQRGEKDRLLFYAVNREQYPITLSLELEAAPTVKTLVNGQSVSVEDGRLVINLAPYELRAFAAPKTAGIVGWEVVVPDDRIRHLRERLAFAQQIEGDLAGREEPDAMEYREALETAWTAFRDGHYWRTRTVLSSAPMMKVYEQFGRYPKEQVYSRFSGILEQTQSGRFEPEEPFTGGKELFADVSSTGEVNLVDSSEFNPAWQFTPVVRSTGGSMTFEVEVPVNGYYQLKVGYVGTEPGVLTGALAEHSLPFPMVFGEPGEPQKAIFPEMLLSEGKARLSFDAANPFGVYAVQLIPILSPIPTTLWSTVGPFNSFWRSNLRKEAMASALKEGADEVYPPQKNAALDQTYKNADGDELQWSQASQVIGLNEEAGVNFAPRAGIISTHFGFAQTFIHSPVAQDVILCIGSDYWANAYLNGNLLKPEGDVEEQKNTGFWYTGWKPRPVRVRLESGTNTLLVKNQGGTMHCWFTAYISKTGNLKISPVPNEPVARK